MYGESSESSKRSFDDMGGVHEVFVIEAVVRATGGVSPCFLYTGHTADSSRPLCKRRSVGSEELSSEDQLVPDCFPSDNEDEACSNPGLLTLYISFEEGSPATKRKKGSKAKPLAPYRMSLRDERDDLLVSYRGLPLQVFTEAQACTAQWGPLTIVFPSRKDLTHFTHSLRRVAITPLTPGTKDSCNMLPPTTAGVAQTQAPAPCPSPATVPTLPLIEEGSEGLPSPPCPPPGPSPSPPSASPPPLSSRAGKGRARAACPAPPPPSPPRISTCLCGTPPPWRHRPPQQVRAAGRARAVVGGAQRAQRRRPPPHPSPLLPRLPPLVCPAAAAQPLRRCGCCHCSPGGRAAPGRRTMRGMKLLDWSRWYGSSRGGGSSSSKV